MKQFKSPPGLVGTLFTEEEKTDTRNTNKLLFISLMLDPVCNLACPDCYIGKKHLTGKELTFVERKNVLDQAAKLGAKTLRIAGEGEPLLDKNFWPLINYALSLGLDIFVFTNGTLINKAMAREISKREKLTMVLKFSGSPEVMEKLTGKKKRFSQANFVKYDGLEIPKYLQYLIDVGLNKPDKNGNSRLGIEMLVRKSNYGYIADIFRWARRNNIIPYVEQNLEAGLALTWEDYRFERVADSDAYRLSEILSKIDQDEFGYYWQPSLPYMVGGICEIEQRGCKKYTYNIVILSNGNAIPCYATYFVLGNIRKKFLKDLLNHPIRKKLLCKNYNCLCRVYSKTTKPIKSPADLDKSVDYKLAY